MVTSKTAYDLLQVNKAKYKPEYAFSKTASELGMTPNQLSALFKNKAKPSPRAFYADAQTLAFIAAGESQD